MLTRAIDRIIVCGAILCVGIVIGIFGAIIGRFVISISGPVRVTVVNVSGCDLSNLRIEAGASSQCSPILRSGLKYRGTLSPKNSQALVVTFDIRGITRNLVCGPVDLGERRTIIFEKDAICAIIVIGDDDASALIKDTEVVSR